MPYLLDNGELITSTLTDLTLRSKETSISMLLNSTAGKYYFFCYDQSVFDS